MPLSVQAAGLDLGEVFAAWSGAASSRERPVSPPEPSTGVTLRDITYPSIIAAAKTWFRLLAPSTSGWTGADHIPRTGGALLAVNHVVVRRLRLWPATPGRQRRLTGRFMAKREVFDHPIAGPIMRSCKHISVDRSAGVASMDEACDFLERGELVGIFPEATISRSFEIKELKTGAIRIAAAAGVPLIPVVLWGTQRMMTKDHPKDFAAARTITVKVGEPLHPDRRRPGRPRPPLLRTAMSGAARRGDPRATPPTSEPGLLVAPRVVRRHRTDAPRRPQRSTARRSVARARAGRDELADLRKRQFMSSCRFVDLSLCR